MGDFTDVLLAVDQAAVWPIVLFEQDLYPVVFLTIDELHGSALARELADEVRFGVDAEFRFLEPVARDDGWHLRLGDMDAESVTNHLRAALICHWRETRLRRHRADPHTTLEILGMPHDQVRACFVERYLR